MKLESLSLSDILNMTLLGDESFYRCEAVDAEIERLNEVIRSRERAMGFVELPDEPAVAHSKSQQKRFNAMRDDKTVQLADEILIWECAICKHWTPVSHKRCACCGKLRAQRTSDD